MSGSIVLETRAAVIDYLSGEKGLRPIAVTETGARDDGKKEINFSAGLSRSRVEIETFLRQIANLLTAGITLNRAIEIILREVSHPAVKKEWQQIHRDVVGGESLATAFARWPQSFPPVYVAMVRAGETGGFLNVVLEQIADFRTREHDLKGRVKAALVYPVLLVIVAAAVLTFLMTYFIPQFSSIFEEFGGSLPMLTRLIMALSGWVLKYILVVTVIIATIILVIKRAIAGKTGKRVIEQAVLNLPVLGKVVIRFGLVRFCRMLGTLLHSGVPLVNALNVARETIGNQAISDTVTDAVDKVKDGMTLARGLALNARFFPGSVTEIIAVAEESGRLDNELLRLAGIYEAELDRQLRMLVAIIEPILLFVMATIVGIVVIGMLLPIFTLQELIH